MSNKILDEILSTKTFITLPPVTMKVLNMLKDDSNLDIKNLSKIIETDAALTAQVIRISNSPLFATRTSTQSVSQSILTLGLNRLTNIVIGVSIFSKEVISENPEMARLLTKYRWHTASTASVSKSLANRLRENFKEYEFIGGLLYNIGKLAMLQYNFGMFQEVINLMQKNRTTDIEAEKEIFGVSHEDVGAKIAESWNLPIELLMVMKYHTRVIEAPIEYQKYISTVRLAAMLCEMWGADFYNGPNMIEFESTNEYKILIKGKTNIDIDFEQITFELETDFKNSQEFLDIIKNAKV